MDFINGNKFLEISDFAIDFDHPDFSFGILKKNSIIYCKTDFIQMLFSNIQFSNKEYILITHMSDYPIDAIKFSLKPKCIKKWFAENAIYNHPNLISIPLGLENHIGKSKGKFTNHKWLEENIQKLKNNLKNYSLYCNWNSNTNPIRKQIISIIKSKNLPITEEYGLNYEQYCENMSHYKFIICPPGNGVDTHRFWEALYLGCIPIVLKHRIYRDFNLPIIQVNKWEEITQELLNQPVVGNTEQLYMSYWKKRILEEFQNL